MVAELRPRRRRRNRSVARLSGLKPGPVVRCEFRAVQRDAAMTDHILEFIRNRHEEGPCLVLDLDGVRDDMLLLPISHMSIENGY